MNESASAQERDRFIIGYGWRMLLVVSFGWAVIQTVRFILPVLLPDIRLDLSLSLTQGGIALTVLNLAYGLSQYPGGRYSDSWSRITVIIPGLILLVLGSFFLWAAWGFLSLVLACGLFGIGMGLYAIPVRALISDLFDQHRGRALGVLAAGADIGGVVASGLAILTLAIATWQTPFFPIAILLGSVAVLYFVWSTESFAYKPTSLGIVSTTRRMITTPSQRWTLVVFTLFYFMMTGVINFLPEFLRTAKGFSPGMASASFALLFGFGIVIKPLAGSISDKFSRRLISATGLLICTVALFILILVGSVAAVLIGIFLFALGYKAQLPLMDAIIMDDAPQSSMGADLGAARTLFLGVGSLGPAVVGFLTDMYNFTVSFAFLGLCLVIAAGIFVWQERQ